MKLFIVGGGSGLGSEIVKAALREKESVGYSTSSIAPLFPEEENVALRVNGCDLRDRTSLNHLIEKIIAFSPDKLVICPVRTQFQKLSDISSEQIFEEFNFNIANIIVLAAAYARAKPSGTLVFILSHICFLYNPGFTLYKVSKEAVDSFAKSIQLEYPSLSVLRVYPGAMKTNFVTHTQYKGPALLAPKDPAFWASQILRKHQGILILFIDRLFLVGMRFLPFWLQKKLFLVLNRLGRHP